METSTLGSMTISVTNDDDDKGSLTLSIDEDNRVVYRVMQPTDITATLDAVSNAFIKEPLNQSLGITFQEGRNFARMWIGRMAEEGNSVVAIDSETKKILGAFVNEDFCNSDPPELKDFLSKSDDGHWEPLLNILGKLEESLMGKYGIPAESADRPNGKYLHMFMIGVTPESSSRGVGKELCRQSCFLAQSRGFKVAFAECTGAISTHLFQKYLGAKREAFIDYATWEGPYSDSINKIPERGHLGASLMIVDLNFTHSLGQSPSFWSHRQDMVIGPEDP